MGRTLTGRNRLRAVALVVGVLIAVGPLLLTARPAQALKVFVVNQTTDQGDLDPNDDFCDVSAAAPGNQCTLRAAIEQANATPGADSIQFNILGDGVRTIRPNRDLPTIFDPVTIDGYTQSDAQPNTATTGTNAVIRIELDGTNVTSGNRRGLYIRDDPVVIKGLAINRFAGAGIAIFGYGSRLDVRISGCFIGTDAGGNFDRGNFGIGVDVNAEGGLVGGQNPADRNIISANGGDGVAVILSDTRVQGNLIGTTQNGLSELGNLGSGVAIYRSNNSVGGPTAGAANTIAYNDEGGVAVYGGEGNSILRNAIFSNTRIGIDLAVDGVTANDPGDPDRGANDLQNKPVLRRATRSGNGTDVGGRLDSTRNATFTVQIFSSPSGNQGKTFRGEQRVQTDASGDATFTIRTAAIPVGHTVTATATNAEGSTSEFSAPVRVQNG